MRDPDEKDEGAPMPTTSDATTAVGAPVRPQQDVADPPAVRFAQRAAEADDVDDYCAPI